MPLTFLMCLLLHLPSIKSNCAYIPKNKDLFQYDSNTHGFELCNQVFDKSAFPVVVNSVDVAINMKASEDCVSTSDDNRYFVGNCILNIIESNLAIEGQDTNTITLTYHADTYPKIIKNTEIACKVPGDYLRVMNLKAESNDRFCKFNKYYIKSCKISTDGLPNVYFGSRPNKNENICRRANNYAFPPLLISCDIPNNIKSYLKSDTSNPFEKPSVYQLKYPYVYDGNKTQILFICTPENIIKNITEDQMNAFATQTKTCNFPDGFLAQNTISKEGCLHNISSYILDCKFTPEANAVIMYEHNTLSCKEDKNVFVILNNNECELPKILPEKYREEVTINCGTKSIPITPTKIFKNSCEVQTKKSHIWIETKDDASKQDLKKDITITCVMKKSDPTHIILKSLEEKEEMCAKPAIEHVSYKDPKEHYFVGDTLDYTCAQGYHAVHEDKKTLTCQVHNEPVGISNVCEAQVSGEKGGEDAMKMRLAMIISICVVLFATAVLSALMVYFLWIKKLCCFKGRK